MTATRHQVAVEVVRARLEQDDPQLPGCDVRAERIVADLYDMGLLSIGRRVECVDVPSGVV